MSARNRPRGTISKEDLTDESHLWNSVLERMKRLQALDESYTEASTKLTQAEQTIPEDDRILNRVWSMQTDIDVAAAALVALEVVSNLHRECLKYSEAKQKIMNEEPDDLIKSLETLMSVRTAMEAETSTPRDRHHLNPVATSAPSASNGKGGRNAKRKLESVAPESRAEQTTSASSAIPVTIPLSSVPSAPVQAPSSSKKASHSGSVSAKVITKAEPTSDSETVKGAAGASTASSTPTSTVGSGQPPVPQPVAPFVVGNEVFYRHKTKDRIDEGEGIICKITSITGDGNKRRYEVQDTEPDENDKFPPPIKASIGQLIAIPTQNAGLPPLSKGQTVFARYPHTNTFYSAEVVGMKKDICRLKFEGEEDAGTEKEVERRYVLDSK